jgi:hypothetical protein
MKNAAGDLPRRVVFYTGSLRERECRVKFYFVIRSVVRTRVTTPSSNPAGRQRSVEVRCRSVEEARASEKTGLGKVNSRASWGAAVQRPYTRGWARRLVFGVYSGPIRTGQVSFD